MASMLRRSDAPPKGPPGVQNVIQSTTRIYTHFTQAGGTKLLFSSTGWVTIELNLEDAGPVSVGQNADLSPTLGGAGRLLQTGVPYKIALDKGTRLYIQADALNRVGVTIEPIPYLEQISMQINSVLGSISNTAVSVINALAALLGRK